MGPETMKMSKIIIEFKNKLSKFIHYIITSLPTPRPEARTNGTPTSLATSVRKDKYSLMTTPLMTTFISATPDPAA